MQRQEMGHLSGLRTSPRGRWFALFFKIVIVLEMVMFARANSDDDPMGEPTAPGLFCISDCVTCPGQAPPGKGPYPYPYYYFYSSKASSFSLHASHFFLLGVFHVVYVLF
ncbi:hypothetical protein SADUNF_Sadunf06G0179000 [Salix dunnii]|uniref:Uncharacterized protein n=1 Tax=Salix dunnii TaxID=1413687 RepID=A0A835MXW3_9ROSI|nr:hypothetical protein SADUNF_Sadunf06G0179000 [Salix dunnii]